MRFFRHALAILLLCTVPALAQKYGGVLTLPHVDTPPSPSIQEEGTVSVVIPFMPVFNNLVIFDQHEPRNSFETIRPELASEWKWGERQWELLTPKGLARPKGCSRDAGILVHGVGTDGAGYGNWLQAIEVQMIEGGVGVHFY